MKKVWFLAFFGLLALISIMGIFGYLFVKYEQDLANESKPLVLVAFIILAMCASLWWSVVYWKSIDEMAKRAHLDAFFWGGGMIAWGIFLPIIAPMLALPNFKISAIEVYSFSLTHAFGLGATAAMAATFLGYVVFWLIWWAKKR